MAHFEAENLIRKSESYDQHYDVLNELGRGRFAVVKKCVCKKSGNTYAAKVIKKSRTNSHGRSGREQLLLEIDILNKSSHPKMVRLFDVFETRSEMQLILELAAGGDLHRHCIEGDVVRTEKEICYLIRQIVEAVRYLHDQSIVHLDLKPDNILLAKTCEIFPEIRLIDFGLSRRLDGPYSQFDIVGTPEYVAPEVLSFEPIDFGSDMWSVGVVTYVLISGISPFAGDDVMETYSNIGQVEYDFDCEEFDDVSENAMDFIEKLLLRNPKKRMTAREAMEHPWMKSLEGGISAEDVLQAQHAQMESPPDDVEISPLVDEEYPSSSESETPLEKSSEFLSRESSVVNGEKEEPSSPKEEDVPVIIHDEKSEGTEINTEADIKVEQDNVEVEQKKEADEKSEAKKNEKNVSDEDKNKKGEVKEKVEYDEEPKATHNDLHSTDEAKEQKIDDEVEKTPLKSESPDISDVLVEKDIAKEKVHSTDEGKKQKIDDEVGKNPLKNESPDISDVSVEKDITKEKVPEECKDDTEKEVEPTKSVTKPPPHVAKKPTKVVEKVSDDTHKSGKTSDVSPEKSYNKSKSHEESKVTSKSHDASPDKSVKKSRSDANLSKITALEKRKQAFELATKADALKGNSKPAARYERSISNKSSSSDTGGHNSKSGSNKSSTDSSPVTQRKVEPKLEPVADTLKPSSTDSVTKVRKEEESRAKSPAQSNSKPSSRSSTPIGDKSPKTNRQPVRAKIPGGIAAKMAGKFSHQSDETPPGRSSPKPSLVKRGSIDKLLRTDNGEKQDMQDGPKASPKLSTKLSKVSSATKSSSPRGSPKVARSVSEPIKTSPKTTRPVKKAPVIAPKGLKTSDKTSEPLVKEDIKEEEVKENATPAKDIKVSMTLGGSVTASGFKLKVGPLISSASKKDTTDDSKESPENSENSSTTPIKTSIGSGGSIKMKLGVGRPNSQKRDEKKTDQPTEGSDGVVRRAPQLKELRGKSTSLRRRADSSPNSPRKNYRRLYVTKVRNSKLYDPDFNIMSNEAAKIMQRVENDVLQVELRLKSTDLKLLP